MCLCGLVFGLVFGFFSWCGARPRYPQVDLFRYPCVCVKAKWAFQTVFEKLDVKVDTIFQTIDKQGIYLHGACPAVHASTLSLALYLVLSWCGARPRHPQVALSLALSLVLSWCGARPRYPQVDLFRRLVRHRHRHRQTQTQIH